MAGFKEFAHEIRKRATDYTNATVQHVAMYAKDNNRVYIIDENGDLVDFQVADIFCYNIDVSQTAEVGETLSVSGNGYFWSDLHVEDNTFIGGIIDVSGNGYFWSDVTIDGNLQVNGNVAINQNLEVSGNSYFYGDVVMGDNLEVDGNVVVGENLEVVGDASISGSLYIAGKLTVDGLIDPTGLQLTPISANPGDANTIWVNSNDGNILYFGSTPISGGSGGGVSGGNIAIPTVPVFGQDQFTATQNGATITEIGSSVISSWTKAGIGFTQGSPSGKSASITQTNISVSGSTGSSVIDDEKVTTRGVQLTPTSANPGDSNTVWVNSADNHLYFGGLDLSAISGSPTNLGVPSTEGTNRVLTNADNGKNLICSAPRIFTVNTGLVVGFGCAFKGGVNFVGTATITDVRTTGAANPWCSLCATGVDTYDIVGSKA